MTEPPRIGDRVVYRGRRWTVRGVAPMSAPGRIHLEDDATGERIDADRDEVQAETELYGRSPNAHPPRSR